MCKRNTYMLHVYIFFSLSLHTRKNANTHSAFRHEHSLENSINTAWASRRQSWHSRTQSTHRTPTKPRVTWKTFEHLRRSVLQVPMPVTDTRLLVYLVCSHSKEPLIENKCVCGCAQSDSHGYVLFLFRFRRSIKQTIDPPPSKPRLATPAYILHTNNRHSSGQCKNTCCNSTYAKSNDRTELGLYCWVINIHKYTIYTIYRTYSST